MRLFAISSGDQDACTSHLLPSTLEYQRPLQQLLMYASQAKRLCVREASTDDTRAQHHSTSSSSADTTTEVQQSTSNQAAPSSSPDFVVSLSQQSSITARRSSPISGNLCAVSGSGGCNTTSDGYHDNCNIASTMTAQAAVTIPGGENELTAKTSTSINQSTATTHPLFQEQSRFTELAQQRHFLQEDTCTEMSSHDHDGDQSDSNSEQQLINKLANETLKEARLELILSIRNLITACNKKKISLVNNPNFTTIIQMIDEERYQTDPEVKAQLALLLCSVAKGGEQNIKVLNDSYADDKIFNLILSSQDDALIEACLRSLRAIMSCPKVSRHHMLYDNTQLLSQQQYSNSGLERMIDYARVSKSNIVQECIADIFDITCNRSKDQVLLINSGALPCIAQILESESRRVVLAALKWSSTMCLKNPMVALETTKSFCPSGKSLLDRLVELMRKDECIEIQLSSAKCFTRIYKALDPNHLKDDPRVVLHVLPTLIRMVHSDQPARIRAEAASNIASLIEGDTRLQNTASICDNLIESLASMLEYELCSMLDEGSHLFHDHSTSDRTDYWRPGLSFYCHSPHSVDASDYESTKSDDCPTDVKYPESIREMKRSAFQALAALASNQETIRKKIFDSCAVMQHLIRGLSDTDQRTLKSVLICLLSLSRSVQQLRTNFNDSALYSSLKNLLITSSPDILNLVLMILCNISLDFSPGKQHFLDSSTIGIICNLIKKSDQSLKLHGMWILMNMVYMLENADLKFQILRTLELEQVVNILETETDEMLVLKTLGFLRNLLSYRPHIDQIMSSHGEPLMRSIMRVLERSTSLRIKEQTICVLTNIADGIQSKAMIMNNRSILNYLAKTIYDEDAGDTRVAAICCITNLAHKDQDGSHLRQNEMKKCGILDKLKSMLNTEDPFLQSRVRTAYNHFLLGIGDKYVS